MGLTLHLRTATTRRAGHCRPGTAMTEMTLAIPLLATVLGFTFFFGWAYMHRHQVFVADRYAVWARVDKGSYPTEDRLNQACFAGKASHCFIDREGAVTETLDELLYEVSGRGPNPELVAEMLLVSNSNFPLGKQARVGASFDPRKQLWSKFTGHMMHTHGREGITWRRDETQNHNSDPDVWETLRNNFYQDLDSSMGGIPAPADGMAHMIQGLYLAHW